MIHRLGTSRNTLYAGLALAIPILYFLCLPIAVGDLAVWVAHGRVFLETDRILRHDIYSVLPTTELIYPSWGLSIAYAALHAAGGLLLVSLAHKALLALVLVVIYRHSLYRLENPWTPANFALLVFFWAGARVACSDRPALVALLPFVVAFPIIDRESELSWRNLGALAALEIVWVNIHGSFLLLPALAAWRMGGRLAGSLLRRSPLEASGADWLATPALLTVALVNPFGWKVFGYVFETMRYSKARHITEWAATALGTEPPQGALFFILCGLVVFTIARRADRGRLARDLASPYFLLLALGFLGIRNTILPFVALLPFAMEHGFLKSGPRQATNGSVLNTAIVSACAAAAVLISPYARPAIASILPAARRVIWDETAPWGVVRAIKASRNDAAVFNDWEYGSFLMLEIPNKIFIDTRNIIYPPSSFDEYLKAIGGASGWQETFEKRGIGFVVLNKRRDGALADALERASGWDRLATDGDAVLYGRPMGAGLTESSAGSRAR